MYLDIFRSDLAQKSTKKAKLMTITKLFKVVRVLYKIKYFFYKNIEMFSSKPLSKKMVLIISNNKLLYFDYKKNVSEI